MREFRKGWPVVLLTATALGLCSIPAPALLGPMVEDHGLFKAILAIAG